MRRVHLFLLILITIASCNTQATSWKPIGNVDYQLVAIDSNSTRLAAETSVVFKSLRHSSYAFGSQGGRDYTGLVSYGGVYCGTQNKVIVFSEEYFSIGRSGRPEMFDSRDLEGPVSSSTPPANAVVPEPESPLDLVAKYVCATYVKSLNLTYSNPSIKNVGLRRIVCTVGLRPKNGDDDIQISVSLDAVGQKLYFEDEWYLPSARISDSTIKFPLPMYLPRKFALIDRATGRFEAETPEPDIRFGGTCQAVTQNKF